MTTFEGRCDGGGEEQNGEEALEAHKESETGCSRIDEEEDLVVLLRQLAITMLLTWGDC